MGASIRTEAWARLPVALHEALLGAVHEIAAATLGHGPASTFFRVVLPLAHRGLTNLAHEQARAFGVGPNRRVLQFSSLSFDASAGYGYDFLTQKPEARATIGSSNCHRHRRPCC